MGNSGSNVSWVTNIEGDMAGYILYVMQSHVDDLRHHNWNVIISFIDFDLFYIPLSGPSVVPSSNHLNTGFTFGIRKIDVKIPIYCC